MVRSTPALLCAMLLGSAGWAGCAGAPEPAVVPMVGETGDLSILVGEWWGEYSSVETGRNGRIRFSLAAKGEEAFGDVVMFAASEHGEDDRRTSPPGERSPLGGRTLTIRFVRTDPGDERVTGTLEPYEDPECRCLVTTTFTGRVSRDRIEGTYETRGGPAYRTTGGRWRVDRKTEADQSDDEA